MSLQGRAEKVAKPKNILFLRENTKIMLIQVGTRVKVQHLFHQNYIVK
jgi:hypothetical protein